MACRPGWSWQGIRLAIFRRTRRNMILESFLCSWRGFLGGFRDDVGLLLSNLGHATGAGESVLLRAWQLEPIYSLASRATLFLRL